MKIIKCLFALSIILSSSLAQADFRKALDALQSVQGTEMLVEVEDAVNKNNNDGLSLFLGTLSDRYRDGEFYIKNKTGNNFYLNSGDVKYHLLLGKNNIPELMGLLERAVSKSDIETQFDLALLKSKLTAKENRFNLSDEELKYFSKLGSKRAKRYLEYKQLNVASGYGEKIPRDDEENFKLFEDLANEGSPDAALMLAMIYLQWLPYEKHPIERFFKTVPSDDGKGMHWLKQYATRAIAGDPIGACKLASEYYAGDKIKQDKRQAYLWYLESAFLTYWGADECTLDGLMVMAYAGDLDAYDKKLVHVIKSEDDKDNQKVKGYLFGLRGKVSRPDDIKTMQNMGVNDQLAYSVKEDRYSLDVYKNGQVNFEGFGNYNDRVASYIVGRDSWRIPKEKVKKLLSEINKEKVFDAPNYALESVLCDTGEIFRSGTIKINDGNRYKEIQYSTIRHSFSTSFMAKIFKIQENIVPTQHLRCGVARVDNDYKNCVAEDTWNIKHADEK